MLGMREKERKDWGGFCCFTRQMVAMVPTMSDPNLNIISVFHIDGRGPSTWTILCHFLSCFSKEIDWCQSSQDWNQHSDMGCWNSRWQLNTCAETLDFMFSIGIIMFHSLETKKWPSFGLYFTQIFVSLLFLFWFLTSDCFSYITKLSGFLFLVNIKCCTLMLTLCD